MYPSPSVYPPNQPPGREARRGEGTSADSWGVERDENAGRGLNTNSWMRWQLWMMPIWLEAQWIQSGCVYPGPEGSEWWEDNCKKTINYRIKFPLHVLPGTWQTHFHISGRFPGGLREDTRKWEYLNPFNKVLYSLNMVITMPRPWRCFWIAQ